jgi:hypothetical protein
VAPVQVNNTQNEGLISPLHIAVWNQQIDSVRTLLNHKADVRARVNKNGMAALHFACNAPNAKPEIIKVCHGQVLGCCTSSNGVCSGLSLIFMVAPTTALCPDAPAALAC